MGGLGRCFFFFFATAVHTNVCFSTSSLHNALVLPTLGKFTGARRCASPHGTATTAPCRVQERPRDEGLPTLEDPKGEHGNIVLQEGRSLHIINRVMHVANLSEASSRDLAGLRQFLYQHQRALLQYRYHFLSMRDPLPTAPILASQRSGGTVARSSEEESKSNAARGTKPRHRATFQSDSAFPSRRGARGSASATGTASASIRTSANPSLSSIRSSESAPPNAGGGHGDISILTAFSLEKRAGNNRLSRDLPRSVVDVIDEEAEMDTMDSVQLRDSEAVQALIDEMRASNDTEDLLRFLRTESR